MITNLGPTQEQIASMRTAVMERVAPTTAPFHVARKPHRVSGRRIGLVAAGAAAVAAALVVTGVIVPSGDRSGATAQAADFLNAAAITTIQTSDPVLQPGQYLRIETHQASGVTDGTRELPMWQQTEVDVLYIPEDPTDVWVLEQRPLRPTVFFGDTEDIAMRGYDPESTNPEYNGIIREAGGDFYGSKPSSLGLEELPRDPEALRDHMYDEYVGGSASIDEDVWVRITDLLRTRLVPADLRAAMYRALALIPGVTIIEKEATLDGRTGVALGRTEPERGSTYRVEIIIDPATGLVIGDRDVTLVDQEEIPAGTDINWSTVETTVVDTAP